MKISNRKKRKVIKHDENNNTFITTALAKTGTDHVKSRCSSQKKINRRKIAKLSRKINRGK